MSDAVKLHELTEKLIAAHEEQGRLLRKLVRAVAVAELLQIPLKGMPAFSLRWACEVLERAYAARQPGNWCLCITMKGEAEAADMQHVFPMPDVPDVLLHDVPDAARWARGALRKQREKNNRVMRHA